MKNIVSKMGGVSMNQSQNNKLTPAESVREMTKSPFFIAAVILFSLGIVLSLVNTFTGWLIKDLYTFANVFGFENTLHQAVALNDAGQWNVTYASLWQYINIVIYVIPGVLMALALWKVYKAGTIEKQNLDQLNKGMTIYQAVCWASIAVLEFLFLLSFGNSTAGSISDAEPGVSKLYLVIPVSVLVIFIVALFFCNSIKRALAIATAAVTDSPFIMDLSLFAPIFIAAAGLLTIVVPIFTGNIILILSSLCAGAAHILFGYLIYDYRQRMLAYATY
jgi:hypothetical protein